jgi:hypothetical protein
MKSLAKRGQRERYLCRMLQRYFDVITNSMKLHSESTQKSETPPPLTENETENDHDDQQQISANDLFEISC